MEVLKMRILVLSIKKIIFPMFILSFILALVLFSESNLQAAKDGLYLWTNSIIPSIFPLFFLTVGLWFYRTFEPLVDCVIFLFLVLANRGICVHIDYKQEDYYKTRCFL